MDITKERRSLPDKVDNGRSLSDTPLDGDEQLSGVLHPQHHRRGERDVLGGAVPVRGRWDMRNSTGCSGPEDCDAVARSGLRRNLQKL